MNKIALELIEKQSKIWLCDKLGIARPTLDVRLKKNNWKKTEIQMLILLNK